MIRVILTALLLLILSMGMALATGDDVNTSSGEHPPYSCEKNDAGDFVCYCTGRADCHEMQDQGVCDVPIPELGEHATGNDTVCEENFADVGEYVCHCTATSSRDNSSRSGTFNSPTENAPVSRPRPRRGGDRFEQLPDGTSNTLSPSEHTNETVPSRRGSAPALDTATDEEGEDASPSRRTVRDHRRSTVQTRNSESEEERNRRIEEMRREVEELERPLQELEGGGG